ncbi:MAG TPA: hypothetical protein VJ951_12350 [Bacteroidales bacterium]|nr:hypothetical protein [Bacteroidales bacterium]
MIEEKQFKSIIQNCFKSVFRTETTNPGFYFLDLGQNYDSFMLRRVMVEMKNHLSDLTNASFGKPLKYQWLGRFDQQVTTKYHLDNASNQSFLMLGYEPTEIESELYIADYVKFSFEIGIEPADYFKKFNPLFTDNEEILRPYITRVKNFSKESFKIVLINNSNSQPECDTLGVLHMARMLKTNSEKSRVLNSMMLEMVSEKTEERDIEVNFLNTDHVST